MLHFLQHFCGINAIFYYSSQTLQTVGLENIWLGNVIVNTANLVGVFIAFRMIDRFAHLLKNWKNFVCFRLGRTILLQISCIGVMLSALLLTLTLLQTNGSQSV